MSDEAINNTTDDQSHYEISLTAGQAFVAFVLLLLSLAASFAFGLVIGRGQGEDRLVVKKEPAVITEASVLKPRNDGKIVELGADDFKPKTDTTVTTTAAPVITETTTTAPPPAPIAETAIRPAAETAPSTPVYAQLLVSTDQHTAETLAATLIDKGFPTAYVERAGGQFKVRVKFNSEADARAAEPKLKEFAKDVWIVK
ncbi:MAG TPA: SPOR domain-containing protein [Thermoanaerobaculia bacterium]|nr:SPOR domain-containing protein [Thermoanaerobaculia bacterium]